MGALLVDFYSSKFPHRPIHQGDQALPGTLKLHERVTYCKHIVINGRRVIPPHESKIDTRAGDAIIQMRHEDVLHVGVVVAILNHEQEGLEEEIDSTKTPLLRVQWFRPYQADWMRIWARQ